jgi:hypothetical protein
LKAGRNNFTFEMTKGGTVGVPDINQTIANGKGKVRIGQVCLLYQRKQ